MTDLPEDRTPPDASEERPTARPRALPTERPDIADWDLDLGDELDWRLENTPELSGLGYDSTPLPEWAIDPYDDPTQWARYTYDDPDDM